jgi:hypothetical protein
MLLIFLLVVTLTSHAKLYNVPPEADLAYVRKQLLVMTQEYVHGVPASGDAASGVCIPVGTNADDGRQRAYAHARHVFRHHGIAVDYESYREHLQRGAHGKYDDRFCMSVADLPHMGRILQRGEI